MGAGASANSSSTFISDVCENLPDEIFVEGAGSIKANGRFILRKCQDAFPAKNFTKCEPSVWFTKDGEEGCWIGLLSAAKNSNHKALKQPRQWIICTDQEILYIAPIIGAKITPPRQGRWELGVGTAPAPTANLQPLPSAFRLSGWKGPYECLNGEYLPLDDGTKLINERSIFKHTPVMTDDVMISGEDTLYMYWSHSAWRVGTNEKLEPNKTECIAFVENNADNPTDMLGKLVWKVTRNISTDEHDFEDVEGVNLAVGTIVNIYISTVEGGDVTSLSVRPWLDDIRILQTQVFSIDTPSQRQQLFLSNKKLEDDGRVLALHGVVAESTIQLVTFNKKDILDELFNDSGAVGAIEAVGDPMPGEGIAVYWQAIVSNTNGRIYMAPDNSSQAVYFDPETGTWEKFGDIFQETRPFANEKTRFMQLSSIDNCMYSPPMLSVLNRFLKIDPEHGTAREVGDDLRPLGGGAKNLAWAEILEGADGCLYAIPWKANSVLRFDPRDTKATTLGKLEASVPYNYYGSVLGPLGRYIFALPAGAARTLCIDTQNQKVELIGDDFGTIDSDDPIVVIKWIDGALAGDNRIYAVPMSGGSTRLLRIDPATKTTSLFGPRLYGPGSLSGDQSMCGWFSCCAGKDGCLYGPPHFGNGILRLDPFSKKVSVITDELPSDFPSKQTLCWSVIDKDGVIWMSPCNPPGHMVRLAPGRPQTALLSTLLQPQHRDLLHEGLHDKHCYGPGLVVALWREANRIGADSALVCKLLETAATSLPTVVTESLEQDNGSTACMLMRTILAVLPPQEKDYYFNPTPNTWAWHEAEAKKRGMSLVSVTSEEEHMTLHKITQGIETWLGGCRKPTSRQPADIFASKGSSLFKGAEDWKWSDGTPWSFTIWNSVEPNNGSSNNAGGEDRVVMSQNTWYDRHFGKFLPGIYRKPRYSPPLKAIRYLITNGDVLRQCFAASDELRRYLIRMLYRVISMKQSDLSVQLPADKLPRSRVQTPVDNTVPTFKTMGTHLEEKWPVIANALSAIGRAPLTFSSNDLNRDSFLSHIVASSAILKAAAPNAWKPLPKHANDWSWPPAPLVPLRAAAKIVEKLGPETLKAVWPVLASAIVTVLIRMEAAVRADVKRAIDILTTVFNKERKSSLGTYHKQLRRARRDPTFPEFKSTAAYLINQLSTLKRQKYRRQTITSFPELYEKAYILSKRFNEFLAALAHKCAGAQKLEAPLKGVGRALEKLVLRPGAAAKIKAKGLEALDTTPLVDVLRGSLECPDFTEIVFILDLLEILDVELGDPKKAMEQGWDLDKFQIRLINMKDRFTTPTSGGWADCMLNFSFVHGDKAQHVMEIQLQHAQMLVVRKEGKAHDRYNSFRSAFELLEAVGREPQDHFQEKADDLPPLQTLENKVMVQNAEIDEMKQQMQSMQQQMQSMQQKMQSMQQQIEQNATQNYEKIIL